MPDATAFVLVLSTESTRNVQFDDERFLLSHWCCQELDGLYRESLAITSQLVELFSLSALQSCLHWNI